MQFDDTKVGAQTRLENRSLYRSGIDCQWTPIQPVSRQFQVGKSQSAQVLRKQFPLRQSAAKTIHRSQGDTLDQVVVDFTSSRKDPHTHYVGLSRVRTLDGLFILNLCPEKINISDSVKVQMQQLRSNRSMELSMHFPYMHADQLQIAFLNVRSLHKHIDYVRSDYSLQHCEIQIYCETRVSHKDSAHMYELNGFHNVMYPAPLQDQRSHYGLAFYSKLPIIHTEQPFSIVPNSAHNTECAVMSLEVSPHVLLTVACVYRRPDPDVHSFRRSIPCLLDHLQTIQSTYAYPQHLTLIMGDFNLDWHDESSRVIMSEALPDFTQLVSQITTDYGSLLDHVYTNIHKDHIQCFVGESYFSDHKPVYAVLNLPSA